MRVTLLLIALSLGACAKKKPAAPPPEPAAQENKNQNPYHDVRPQKVKADVEAIQKAEEDRNDKRIEQMKAE